LPCAATLCCDARYTCPALSLVTFDERDVQNFMVRCLLVKVNNDSLTLDMLTFVWILQTYRKYLTVIKNYKYDSLPNFEFVLCSRNLNLYLWYLSTGIDHCTK
jgi:hypothetical protein